MDNLICDAMIFDYKQMVAEDIPGKKGVKLRGLFQKAESKNANGRIYPAGLMVREVAKLQPMIKESRCLGEIDHPAEAKIHLDRVSHKIAFLEMKGNDVNGVLESILTPPGYLLEGFVKSGVKLGISSRGTGSLKEGSEGSIVQDDYSMITFDIVHDPSTNDAYLIREHRDHKIEVARRKDALNQALVYAARKLFEGR